MLALLACLFLPAGPTTTTAHADAHPASGGGRIPLVRVGVAPEVAEVRLSADGPWRLGVVGSGTRPVEIPAGETWIARPEDGRLLLLDAAGARRAVVAETLFAYPEDLEAGPLQINGKPYRGEALVWASGDRATAVNVVDLESYVRAVLPLEMGTQPAGRVAALRAQAVAARSYTLSMLGRWAARGFDLLATVEDQVYGGVTAERPGCTEAVEETRGEIAVHEGRPILAFYSSTCGGHTAGVDEVWRRPASPYLRGVRDIGRGAEASFCHISPQFRWKETWTAKEFDSILQKNLPRVRSGWSAKRYGRFTGLSIRGRSDSRRASCLRLQFERGSVDLAGDEIRWVLRRKNGEGLRSALLTDAGVSRRKKRPAMVTIQGQGFGHGVGMCQYGAMGMAEAGYRHDEIVRHYYRGSVVNRFY